MLPRSMLWIGTLPEDDVKYCESESKNYRFPIYIVRMPSQVCPPVHLGLNETIGVSFLGFVLGAILFGVTVQQTYQYFRNYAEDPITQKLIVTVLCLLDAVHLAFSVHLLYFYIIHNFGNIEAIQHAVWSLKALGTVQVLVIWLVQSLYIVRMCKLSQLWILRRVRRMLLIGATLIGIIAFAVGIIFIVGLNRLTCIIPLSGFSWIIYLAFGSTVFIDCIIATSMFFLLNKSFVGIKRTDDIIWTLTQFFVSSGLLTSLASMSYIILFASRPKTLLFLGMTFLITRLYVNSFLAMCNARNRLRSELDRTIQLNLSSITGFIVTTKTKDPIALGSNSEAGEGQNQSVSVPPPMSWNCDLGVIDTATITV